MQPTLEPSPSNDPPPSYNTGISAETLPGYALSDLNQPVKVYTRMQHVETVVPAAVEDYVKAQPQLASDEEANILNPIADNNVSTLNYIFSFAYFTFTFVVPTILPGKPRYCQLQSWGLEHNIPAVVCF